MLKLIETKTPELMRFCEKDIFGIRILSYLNAYGTAYPFAMFWEQRDDSGVLTAVISKIDGAVTVCAIDGANRVEITEFTKMIGFDSIFIENCSIAEWDSYDIQRGSIMLLNNIAGEYDINDGINFTKSVDLWKIYDIITASDYYTRFYAPPNRRCADYTKIAPAIYDIMPSKRRRGSRRCGFAEPKAPRSFALRTLCLAKAAEKRPSGADGACNASRHCFCGIINSTPDDEIKDFGRGMEKEYHENLLQDGKGPICAPHGAAACFQDNAKEKETLNFEAWLLDISHKIRHSCADILAAELEEKLVACALATAITENGAIIGAVATIPEYRKRGIGTAVVARLCKSLLPRKIFICCEAENINFYKNIGFVENGGFVILKEKN